MDPSGDSNAPQPTSAPQPMPVSSIPATPPATPSAQSGPEPTTPTLQTLPQNPATQSPTQPQPTKSLFQRKQTWAFVVLGAIVIISLAFSVFELSENMIAQDRVIELEQEVSEKDQLIIKYAAQIGQQVEESSRPGYIDPANNTAKKGYIYIGEWGMKIKIPSSLKFVSYNYIARIIQDSAEISTVCIWAAPRALESIPAFADPEQNPSGLGCATRYHLDSAINSSQEPFYQNGDYIYRYIPSPTISSDETELALETQATEAIETMFTTENFTTF